MGTSNKRRRRRLAAGLLTAAVLAGCGAGAGSTPGEDLLEAGYAGTERPAPRTGPVAQRDKDVWVVSCALVSEHCDAPVLGFEEAAAELGWHVTVEDDVDASEHTEAVRAALAAGADGIVLAGVDCQLVPTALDDAVHAGVPTVALGSVDCDDPRVGQTRRFSAEVNLGRGRETYRQFARAWGATKAAWAVDRLDGSGTVLDVRLENSAFARVVSEGFTDEIERCSSCRVVGVELSVGAVLGGSFGDRVAAALEQHPEAEAVHFPDDEAARQAAAALHRSGRPDLAVIGGEGLPANLEAIRSGDGQDAALAIPTDWLGWAAADTLNRIFAGDRTIPDSGIGWTLVDGDHDVPAGRGFEPATDFRAAYRRTWLAPTAGAT